VPLGEPGQFVGQLPFGALFEEFQGIGGVDWARGLVAFGVRFLALDPGALLLDKKLCVAQ
jgi:hypothetical protein